MTGDDMTAIRIEGLSEFVRGVKRMDRESGKMVRLAFNQASQVVVDEAAPRVPRRSGRAAASLKARSTQTLARVAGGSSKAPYYPWLDFGGKVGRNDSVSRPFFKEGRYIYKSYEDKKRSGEFERIMQDALVDVAKSSGVEVT